MSTVQIKRFIFFLLVLLIESIVVCSCSDQDQELTDPTEQIKALVEFKDADVKILSVMLGTSEKELNSIICGESFPSASIAERIKELYTFAIENGRSFNKLRAAYDPDFTWFDHILLSPTIHPWFFWIITGLLTWFALFRNTTLSFIRKSTVIYSDGLYLTVARLSRIGLVIEGLVFLIAYLFSTILQ